MFVGPGAARRSDQTAWGFIPFTLALSSKQNFVHLVAHPYLNTKVLQGRGERRGKECGIPEQVPCPQNYCIWSWILGTSRKMTA